MSESSQDNPKPVELNNTSPLDIIQKELEGLNAKSSTETDPTMVKKGYYSSEQIPGFSYYVQHVDGSSNVWDEMIRNFKIGRKYVNADIFNDGIIIWSDNTVHANLLVVPEAREKSLIGKIDCWKASEDQIPEITVTSDDADMIERVGGYLGRSINPQTQMKVFSQPDNASNLTPIGIHR